MGSPERTILTQLKSTLATVTTSGGYNYDLSGADQVHIGGTFLPDRVPSAYIFAGTTTSALIPGRTALNSYGRTQLVTVEMWIGNNSTDPAESHLSALDAQHDLMMVIESDRTIGGNVDDVIINAERSYSVAEMPGVTVAILELTLRYREVGGA